MNWRMGHPRNLPPPRRREFFWILSGPSGFPSLPCSPCFSLSPESASPRRPAAADYPEVPEGLTTLPSDLPAPAVSVLGSRKVGPKTYLSILVDMLQKGNLTITGGYGESVKRRLQSRVWFTRQFEPDQPWEKEVYSALTSFSVSDLLKPHSDMLKSE